MNESQTPDTTSYPPWTEEQVKLLNEYQACEFFHPYTCGGPYCRETLQATPEGWVCPKCGYRQTWAGAGLLEMMRSPHIERLKAFHAGLQKQTSTER